MKYLGEQFDIHAGGIDHIPIHHTNEIAQSEAATGKKPWVKFWLHNEFLVLNKGKMSKSTGGFLTLQKLVDDGFEPLDYRYFLIGGHYRSQLQFSVESLEGAKNARKSLVDKVRALAAKCDINAAIDAASGQAAASAAGTAAGTAGQAPFTGKTASYIEEFNKAIEDDLNTPRALAELWGVLKEGQAETETLAAVFDMDRVLGLGLREACKEEPKKIGEDAFPREIQELIEKRAQAKKAKDFALADGIRQSLKERGIILEDGPSGTTWRKSAL